MQNKDNKKSFQSPTFSLENTESYKDKLKEMKTLAIENIAFNEEIKVNANRMRVLAKELGVDIPPLINNDIKSIRGLVVRLRNKLQRIRPLN